MLSEREEFEKWYASLPAFAGKWDSAIDGYWKAWQSRALLAKESEPEDFDKWMKNPYTVVLQKSIEEDYVPKESAAGAVPVAYIDAIDLDHLRENSMHECVLHTASGSNDFIPLFAAATTSPIGGAVPAEVRAKVEDLFGEYWELAFKEASTGIAQSDAANLLLHKLHQLLAAAPTEAKSDAISELIAKHEELLENNPYCYFELAYTRQTDWMAWICSKPQTEDPERIVLASGQGSTPEEACHIALNALTPLFEAKSEPSKEEEDSE